MTGSNLRNLDCSNTRCQKTFDDGGLSEEAGHEVSKLNYVRPSQQQVQGTTSLQNIETKKNLTSFQNGQGEVEGEGGYWHGVNCFRSGFYFLKQQRMKEVASNHSTFFGY